MRGERPIAEPPRVKEQGLEIFFYLASPKTFIRAACAERLSPLFDLSGSVLNFFDCLKGLRCFFNLKATFVHGDFQDTQ